MEIAKLEMPDFIRNIQTMLFLPGGQLCKPSQGGRWVGRDGRSPVGLLALGLGPFSLGRESSLGSLQCQGGFAQQTWRSCQPSKMLSPLFQGSWRTWSCMGAGAVWVGSPALALGRGRGCKPVRSRARGGSCERAVLAPGRKISPHPVSWASLSLSVGWKSSRPE